MRFFLDAICLAHAISRKYGILANGALTLSVYRGLSTGGGRNTPALRISYLVVMCMAILVPLMTPSVGTSGTSGNGASGNPLITGYKEFLKTLNTTDRNSSLAARDEFVKRFENAPGEVSSEGFRVFRRFYGDVVNMCGRKYFSPIDITFKNTYRKDYQDLLNEIMSISARGVTVTPSLLEDDPIAVMHGRGAEFIAEMKRKYGAAVDDLIDFRKCGIGFSWGEGDWYLGEDARFLADAASVGGGLGDFMRFNAEESRQRLGHDAGLLITWEELRQKIIRYEQFAKSHPDLPETKSEIEPDLYRFISFYLIGTENTHAYDMNLLMKSNDRGTGKIDPKLRTSYEAFLKENRDSSYYPLIRDVYDILKRHGFTFSDELGAFLEKSKYDPGSLHDYFYRLMMEKKKSR